MCTCTHALRLIEKQEHWTELIFDTANEQHGLDPTVLFSLLKRSRGACQVIQLARCVAKKRRENAECMHLACL